MTITTTTATTCKTCDFFCLIKNVLDNVVCSFRAFVGHCHQGRCQEAQLDGRKRRRGQLAHSKRRSDNICQTGPFTTHILRTARGHNRLCQVFLLDKIKLSTSGSKQLSLRNPLVPFCQLVFHCVLLESLDSLDLLWALFNDLRTRMSLAQKKKKRVTEKNVLRKKNESRPVLRQRIS